MPYLKLKTNVSISEQQSPALLCKLSKLLAEETSKPERYVMAELKQQNQMIFGGSADPLAYLECKSIGLSSDQVKSLSASISHLLSNELQLPPDRIYIEFSNAAANYWGWNGSTFG